MNRTDAVDVLDRMRRAAFALAWKSSALAFILEKRARRIEARAAAAITFALTLSIVAPALMLAIGPVVFGVPHVASEVRYLVVRRGLGRGFVGAVVLLCASIASLRVAASLTNAPIFFARAEVAVGLAFILSGGILALARGGQRSRFVLIFTMIGAAASLAFLHPIFARLFFVHVHNFGALVLWMAFFRKKRGLPWLVLTLLVGSVALLVSGVTVPWTTRIGALHSFGVDVADVAGWLTPGVAARVAVPLALVHAFSDSVHYTTWLSVIPEEESRAEGSLTFRMTVRSLVADFGRVGVALVFGALAIVLICAAVNLAATRALYFSIAGFHGYLELAILAYVITRETKSKG